METDEKERIRQEGLLKPLGNAVAYVDDKTGEQFQVTRYADGYKDGDLNHISLKGKTAVPVKTEVGNVDLTGGGYGSSKDVTLQKAQYRGMWTANEIMGQANKFTTADKTQLNSGLDRLKQLAIKGFSPQLVKAFVSEELSGYSPAVKKFFVELSRMSAEERHALFGSALTKTETESSEDFMARVQGLSLDSLLSRIESGYRANERFLLSEDRVYDGNKWSENIARGQFTNMGPVSVPEDVSARRAEIARIKAELEEEDAN
jgi:hypothetical protein